MLIALGGLAVVLPAGPVVLFAGPVAAGFGCATLVPSALSAAARLPGLGEGVGVTLVSWLMRVGLLLTGPVVGLLTDAFDLRVGLLVLVATGAATLALAGSLRASENRAERLPRYEPNWTYGDDRSRTHRKRG